MTPFFILRAANRGANLSARKAAQRSIAFRLTASERK